MVGMAVINLKNNTCTVRKYTIEDAIDLLRKIVHIPHSTRFIRIAHYKCFNEGYWNESTIDYLYSRQIPTLQELRLWETFPIHIER